MMDATRIRVEISHDFRLSATLFSSHTHQRYNVRLNKSNKLHWRNTTETVLPDGSIDYGSSSSGTDKLTVHSYAAGGMTCIEWVRFPVEIIDDLRQSVANFRRACELFLVTTEYRELGVVSNGWKSHAVAVGLKLNVAA